MFKIIRNWFIGFAFWGIVGVGIILGLHFCMYVDSEPSPNAFKYLAQKEPAIVLVDDVCTGFIIERDLVMTAGHCIRDPKAKTIEVKFDGAKITKMGTFIRSSKTSDLALIAIETEERVPLSFAENLPSKDETYHIKGYPGGLKFVVTLPVVHSAWLKDFDVYSGVGVKGFSGSPVIDRNGDVHGVLVMGEFVMVYDSFFRMQTNTFWLAYVEKVSNIKAFLREKNE